MKKPGVMIYFTMRPSRKLPMEDRLRLYDAMLDYGETGVVPELEGPLALLWDYFQPQLELDNARYESIRAKRAKAGRLGGQACQGSRQPEQDADGVLLLHRNAPSGLQDPSQPQPFYIHVAKNRHGRTGTVELNWYPPVNRFEDRSGKWPVMSWR